MAAPATLLGSSVGKKLVMAVTGIVLSLFVLGHMAGNLQAFLPNGPEALFGMACAHIDANEAEANKLADRALKANGMNAEAYLAKGAIAQKQKHTDDARAAYRRYLYLAPNGRYADEVRVILQNLK